MAAADIAVIGAAVSSVAAVLLALRHLRRKGRATWRDAIVVPATFVCWFALTATGWRAKSLSNLIESFMLLGVVAAIMVARAAIGASDPRRAGNVAIAAGLAAALVLWALTPTLPE